MMDTLKIINADFLSSEEKINLFATKNISLDADLINLVFSSELELDEQLELIKNIKLNQNSVPKKIETKIIEEKTKSKSTYKTKEEVDEELESSATRPLEKDEFDLIINTIKNGYTYIDEFGKDRIRRPNHQIALILSVQATIGFRIQDILRLRLSDIRGDKISFREQKTKKLQYRQINLQFIESLQEYAAINKIDYNDYLFKMRRRNVQHMLQRATEYLSLDSIGTHSFRKFFAITVYKNSNNNIELVRNLLNHSTVAVTQRYINVDQDQIDAYSSSINFMQNI